VAPPIPTNTRSLFLLASVSKPYAAVTAHRLAEAGRIDLAAPIRRYLPSLPGWGDSVSVRQILAHSSGILDFTDVSGWNDTARADSYIRLALASPLRFRPGTRFEYSNTNYALLEQIIERVTGESYAATAAKLVLAPLGLSQTHFDCPSSWATDLARGYRLGPGGNIVAVPRPGRDHYPDATAGLCASAADVARFFSSILSGRLLGPQSVEDLHTADGGDPEDTRFGAGLGVTHETTGDVWSHSGGFPGANTEVAIWPKDSLVIVVLTNSGGGEAEHLNRNIARSVFGMTPVADLPVADLSVAADVSGSYAGRYNTSDGRLFVGERDGHVFVFGQRCYNQGGDVFICDPDKSRTVRFVRDSTGVREAWLYIEGVRRLRGRRAQPQEPVSFRPP
jgi:CubicO group peptidase (beta-lactamase class C family)